MTRQPPPKPSAVTVRPISRDCYRIIPEAGYRVTVFTRPDRSAEAHVSNGEMTIALNIEAPSNLQRLKFSTCAGTDGVDIVYEDLPVDLPAEESAE